MTDAHDPTEAQALRMSRVLWFGLVAAQLAFGAAVVILTVGEFVPQNPRFYPLLLYVSAGALIVLVPSAHGARNALYKANWRGSAVTPRGYVVANVAMLALLETVSFIALLAALLIGAAWPTALLALISLGVQLANFPHGKPMRAR